MNISKGQEFRVVSSVSYHNEQFPATNTGWVTTNDHEPGIKLDNSHGYLVVAECSAVQNIDICPHCCLMYGTPSNKCEHCKSRISSPAST